MSDDPLLWLLLLQLVFILLNAVFACAEIAVITMNDNKLARLVAAGDRRALRLQKLTDQPSRFLATIQVGITLVSLLSSAVAAENFSSRLSGWFASLGIGIPAPVLSILSVVVITLILTYFTVLLGELIPKRIAMERAESIALSMSGLIYAVSRIFTPAVWLFTVSSNGLLRLFGVDPSGSSEENTEEEIRMMLDAGKQKGVIQQDEQEMIQNIFEFDDIPVGELMTHRTEVSLLWLDETDEEWDRTIKESRHSIYPVCGDSADDVKGVLYAKDYFRLKDPTRDNVMKHAVKAAHFIPKSLRADVLFRNMKKSRNHFAVVVDEYGGMGGIVTMSDLLEELVGDLDDDVTMPAEAPEIERIDSKTWRIRGIAPLEDVAVQLGVRLPEEDYDTFGGMVFGALGTIPDDGAAPEVEAYGLQIKVTKIEERRLESAVVCLTDAPAGEKSEEDE